MPVPRAATYTVLGLAATACGCSPTAMLAITLPRAGSIFESVPDASFATHTLPPLETKMPLGPSPTGTVPTTRFVAGSIRDAVPSSLFATHTPSVPAATATGALPTWIGVTRPEPGSSRETTPLSLLVTHTAPSPTASASAPASIENGLPGLSDRGSTRTTVLSSEFATHTPPRP